MSSEHLDNPTDVVMFSREMILELQEHQKEKKPLGKISTDEIKVLVIREVKRRISLIENTTDKVIIRRQSVHIANYTRFLYTMIVRDLCKEAEEECQF